MRSAHEKLCMLYIPSCTHWQQETSAPSTSLLPHSLPQEKHSLRRLMVICPSQLHCPPHDNTMFCFLATVLSASITIALFPSLTANHTAHLWAILPSVSWQYQSSNRELTLLHLTRALSTSKQQLSLLLDSHPLCFLTTTLSTSRPPLLRLYSNILYFLTATLSASWQQYTLLIDNHSLCLL